MASIPKEITIERENIEKALNNLKIVFAKKERTFIELSAIATCLHNIYNGIENIIKQMLYVKNIKIQKSETWHKDLLKIGTNNNVITENLKDKLFEYLTFRHFFVHSYGFMLEKNQLEALAGNIPEIWLQFISEVDKYFS